MITFAFIGLALGALVGGLTAGAVSGLRPALAGVMAVLVAGGSIGAAVSAGLIAGDRATVEVTAARLTQGLDVDVGDGALTTYDLIAGKDTLARLELTVENLGAHSMTVSCHELAMASSYGGTPPGVESDAAGEVIPLASLPTVGGRGDVRTMETNCWIPGYDLALEANWDVSMRIHITGQPDTIYDFGGRPFKATGDIRLLVVPMTWPNSTVSASELHPWSYCGGMTGEKLKTDCPGVEPRPLYTPWTDAHSATAFETLTELQRAWPIRSGVGGFDLTGSTTPGPGTPGLRYFFTPVTSPCTGPTLDAASGLQQVVCDPDPRATATLLAASMNAELAAKDASDGGHRDRFDGSVVLQATNPSMTGGQWQAGTGTWSEIDTNTYGPSSLVLAQEMSHSFGEVEAISPHSDTTRHSKDKYIPLWDGLPMIDMTDHVNETSVRSIMYPFFDPGDSAAEDALEGVEWNHLRDGFVVYGGPNVTTTGLRLVASTSAGPQLIVEGLVDGSGSVSIQYVARDSTGLRLTVPGPSDSPLSFVFRDASGNELSRIPFGSAAQPGHPGSTAQGFLLVMALPAAAARYEVVRGQSVVATGALINRVLTAPQVNVQMGSGDSARVTWPAASGTSALLFWDPGPGRSRIPLGVFPGGAANLTGEFLQQTDSGHFVVRLSDGFNTVEGVSPAVHVSAHAPHVAITSPVPAIAYRASEPIRLTALGYDDTDGSLNGSALTWTIDGTQAGHGQLITRQLRPGTHRLMVTAVDSHGLKASADVSVSVVGDPLSAGAPAGTDHPLASVSLVDMGSCPSPLQPQVKLTTAGPDLQLAVDASWLQASVVAGAVHLKVDCGRVPGGGHPGVAQLFLRQGSSVQRISLVVDRPGPDYLPWIVTAIGGLGIGALAGLIRPGSPRWGLLGRRRRVF